LHTSRPGHDKDDDDDFEGNDDERNENDEEGGENGCGGGEDDNESDESRQYRGKPGVLHSSDFNFSGESQKGSESSDGGNDWDGGGGCDSHVESDSGDSDEDLSHARKGKRKKPVLDESDTDMIERWASSENENVIDRAQDDGDDDSGDDTSFSVLFPHNKACVVKRVVPKAAEEDDSDDDFEREAPAAEKAAPKAAEEDDSDDDEYDSDDDFEREVPAAEKAAPKAAEEDDSDDYKDAKATDEDDSDDSEDKDDEGAGKAPVVGSVGDVVCQAVAHLRDVIDRLTIIKLVNIMMSPPPTRDQSEDTFMKATKLGKKDSAACRNHLTYPPPIFWGYFKTNERKVVLILSCFLSQCPSCPALMPFLPSLVSFFPSSTRFPALPCPSCSCYSSPLPICLLLPFFFSISFPASSFPFPSQEAHQNCHGPGEGGRARTHIRN
jgi:hypothetical protein